MDGEEVTADSADSGYEPPQTQMPAALVIALVLQLVGSFVIRIALADIEQSRGFDDYDTLRAAAARWELLGRVLPFVSLGLALAGAFELVRGSRERARLGAQLMVGALLLGLAAKLGVELGRLDPSWRDTVNPWTDVAVGSSRTAQWAFAACWPGVTLGLVVAGWRDRSVRWLALPLFAASVIPGSYAILDLRHLLGVTRQGAFAFGMMVEIFFVAAFLFALFRSAPIADPFGGWERAAASLERAARALRLWMIFVAFEVVLIAWLFVTGGSSPLMTWLLAHDVGSWGQLGAALAMTLLAGASLGASSLVMIDAPRLRLIFTAALFTSTAAMGALQMTDASVSGALSLLRPLLLIASVALYAASLHGFVTLLNAQAVGKKLSYAIGIVIVVLGAGAGAMQLAATSPGLRAILICMAVQAAALLYVLWQMRTFTLQIAVRLRQREKLPAATVRRRYPV